MEPEASWTEALERAEAISRERHTAAETEPVRRALLGQAYLGLGDPERAREAVQAGVQMAGARGQVDAEISARIAQARALLGADGSAARAEIEAALARALELVDATGAKIREPQVREELARLAHECGDEEGWQKELAEAHRLFSEIGATGHAERLAGELALSR